VGRARVEDEGVIERDPGNGPALRPEPARARDLRSIEALEREGYLGPIGSPWEAQILSITCLTTV